MIYSKLIISILVFLNRRKEILVTRKSLIRVSPDKNVNLNSCWFILIGVIGMRDDTKDEVSK